MVENPYFKIIELLVRQRSLNKAMTNAPLGSRMGLRYGPLLPDRHRKTLTIINLISMLLDVKKMYCCIVM